MSAMRSSRQRRARSTRQAPAPGDRTYASPLVRAETDCSEVGPLRRPEFRNRGACLLNAKREYPCCYNILSLQNARAITNIEAMREGGRNDFRLSRMASSV